MKQCRVPFNIDLEIPLTNFPIADTLKIDVVDSLSSIPPCDLLVATARGAADSTGDPSTESGESSANLAGPVNSALDQLVSGELSRLIAEREFKAKQTSTVYVRMPRESRFKYVGVLGLGNEQNNQWTIMDGFNKKKKENEGLKLMDSFAASKCGKPLSNLSNTLKVKSMALHIDTCDFSPESLQALIEGFLLSINQDERFKSKQILLQQQQQQQQRQQENLSKSLTSTIERITVAIDCHHGNNISNTDFQLCKSAILKAPEFARGINFCRELTAAPPNFCNPESLARAAVAMATEKGLGHSVLGREECVNRKMGSYLAVNQGSLYEPQFIHLTYRPTGGEIKKKIVLIGKGICMDTGGYNLKVSGAGIETMKMDMAGAAAVFGCASIIGSIKPPDVEVHFLVAAAENMIDSTAYRPGDIVQSSSGKTIEINNTDAEGRLTLADALFYAENEIKPDAILDCATLTSASRIALGLTVGSVYSTNTDWMNLVLAAGKKSGCALWPMPLFSDYKKLNESKYADLSNSPGTAHGGSITAALFLSEFVKNTPWAHIDMAGPVYDSTSKEFTGYGTKLLTQIILDRSSSVKAQ